MLQTLKLTSKNWKNSKIIKSKFLTAIENEGESDSCLALNLSFSLRLPQKNLHHFFFKHLQYNRFVFKK